MAYANDINSCTFTGRLTSNPKVGASTYGRWMYFSLAVNQRTFDTDKGEYATVPVFLDCFAYDDVVNQVEGKLFQGTQVFIECILCSQTMNHVNRGYSPERFFFQVTNIEIGKQPKKQPYRATRWIPPENIEE